MVHGLLGPSGFLGSKRALLHVLAGELVQLAEGGLAGDDLLSAGCLRVEHELVDFALPGRKLASDRECAGNVGGIVVVLSADVHDHDLPGLHPALA